MQEESIQSMTELLERLIGRYGYKGQSGVSKALNEFLKLINSLRDVLDDPQAQTQYHLHFLSFFEKISVNIRGVGKLYYALAHADQDWRPAEQNISVPFDKGRILIKQLDGQAVCKLFSAQSTEQKWAVEKQMMPAHYWACLFRITPYSYYLFSYNNSQPEAKRFVRFVDSLVRTLSAIHNERRETRELHQNIKRLEEQLIKKEGHLVSVERNLRRRVYEIHNLLEVSSELYSILNLNQLINSALLIIVGQIGCQRSLALLYDNNLRRYSKKYAKGVDPLELSDFELAVDHPIITYFEHNRRAVTVEHLAEKEEFRPFSEYIAKRRIEVLAPIIHSERVQGIIGSGQLLSEQKFGKDELDILNILINMISISVSNAQTYEEVKNLSLTDGMTNLNNYRYFEDRLKEEINRARRNNTQVSLLMLDIDHFKNYNDTLGHQAGDEALRSVGWILKNAVREEDIVNRYGGEEFCVILPGIPKEVIPILGERIRSKIDEYPFYKENVQPGGKLTVSLGGSCFPSDADNFEDLVYKADQALYKSKSAGRNCLTLYNES